MKQSEVDELLKGIESSGPAENDAGTADEENIGWDDVKEEMELSRTKVPKTEISEAKFTEIANAAKPGPDMGLDFILDIPLTLTVELGRSRMLINELLQLGQGSVIELSKLAGEPMDIYINQRLIARGEVVVINEKFGIRLTDIVSPAERVNKLR
jgi:flagellar motor switch protein FliN/FliY